MRREQHSEREQGGDQTQLESSGADDLDRFKRAFTRAPIRMAAIAAIVAGIYFAWSQGSEPAFRTTATVRVGDVRERDPQVEHRRIPTGTIDEGEALSTLRSRTLAADVARSLGLATWVTDESAPPLRRAARRLIGRSSADFELSVQLDTAPGTDLRVRFTGPRTVRIHGDAGQTEHAFENGVPIPIDGGRGSLTLEVTGAPDDRTWRIERITEEDAAARVRRTLQVHKQQHQPGTLAVVVTDQDPVRCARIANGYATAFLAADVAQTEARAEDTVRFLDAELARRKDRLAELESLQAELLEAHPDAINAEAASQELSEREGVWDDLHRKARARRQSAERAMLAIEAGQTVRQALASSSAQHPPEILLMLQTLNEEESRLRSVARGSEDTGYRKTLLLKADDHTIEAQRFETRVQDLEQILAAIQGGDDRALARLGGDLAREGSISVDWTMRLWMTELERTRGEIQTFAAEFTEEYPPLIAARSRATHFREQIVGGLEQLLEGQRATLAQKRLHAQFWKDLFERYPVEEAALVKVSIEQIRTELIAAIRSQVDGLRMDEAAAKREHGRVFARLASIANAGRTLASTRLERRELDTVVGELLRDVENARIAAGGITASVRLIDPAVEPRAPMKPRAGLSLIAGLLLGLFCALAWAWLDAHRSGLFEAPRGQSLSASSLPVCGRVAVTGPADGARRRIKMAVDGQRVHTPWLPLVEAPESDAAMGYRSLRARLRQMEVDGGEPVRTLGITSTRSGEGTSTVAASLAMARAQLGERVLLVDGNLGSPSIQRSFDAVGLQAEDVFGDDTRDALGVRTRPNANDAAGRGLADCLDATAHWSEVARPSGFPTLDVLDAGTSFVVSTDLFASRRFHQFCAQMGRTYDLVVVDLASLESSPDAEAAAAAMDAVLVVESEIKPPSARALDRTIERLYEAGGRVLGLVRTTAVERRAASSASRAA